MLRTRKIRICHLDFKIRMVEGSPGSPLGEIHVSKQWIHIKRRQQKQTLADTCWHEVWHGVEEILGIHKIRQEEVRMQLFAQFMVSLFRDNPEFIQEMLDLSAGKQPLKKGRKSGSITCRRGIGRDPSGRFSNSNKQESRA